MAVAGLQIKVLNTKAVSAETEACAGAANASNAAVAAASRGQRFRKVSCLFIVLSVGGGTSPEMPRENVLAMLEALEQFNTSHV